jgi:hypothetical protein
MGKRRRRPLTQVKSGIALSNLAITATLPTRLGGPLRRGHSKRSLTRINSKGMEINVSVDGLERAKSGFRLTSNDNSNSNVVVVAQESFITSRTARVLLAGAGFLADAVRDSFRRAIVMCHPHSLGVRTRSLLCSV